jgi:hypothetical protein
MIPSKFASDFAKPITDELATYDPVTGKIIGQSSYCWEKITEW